MISSTFFLSTLVAAYAIGGVLADLTLDTPSNFTQCGTFHLSWSNGTPPYDLVVVPASNPCDDDILVDYGYHNGTSMTSVMSVPAGEEIVFSLIDADSNEAWSNTFTVLDSDNTSCISTSLLSSAGVSATGSASTGASAATTTAGDSSSKTETSSSASSSLVPVGAAGSEPLSGSSSNASPLRHISMSLVAIGAFTASVIMTL
ncbi:hypothetical protein FISHEDRAFT_62181 [Fistulina hepatica ATCC 64428]|nr:hypothetical protein FISHEDRAFT_62181 [Fistulina hepatica ATCC 64428]